jgi:hypothetical protein
MALMTKVGSSPAKAGGSVKVPPVKKAPVK